MSKLPARPKTPGYRVAVLVRRCIALRRRMGLNRVRFTHFLNSYFLNKEDAIGYAAVTTWERGINRPIGEQALALVAYKEFAENRFKELGYFYLHVPEVNPLKRIVYDGDHAPIPGEKKRRYSWNMSTHVMDPKTETFVPE